MNVTEKLRHNLFQLVKMDYGFEIYNMNDSAIRFSFYHLGSVYNAFCSTVYFRGEWTTPGIDWQYARKNKKAAKHAAAVVDCLISMQGTADNIAENETNYYKALSEKIFDAKYSVHVELHTLQGGVNT